MVYVLVSERGKRIKTYQGKAALLNVARDWYEGTFWGCGHTEKEALTKARFYTDGGYRSLLFRQIAGAAS